MPNPKHLVAIFGGAVSGAEAAFQLAEKGIPSVVFDQNALPYGKIEDGLPKWHVKLRDKEEGRINEKLSHPLVHFVPKTALGKELDFEDVAKNWGFSAILIAIGAWKDRPLPVDGVDAYVGKGLAYQNPFIYWFNHKHEPGYTGPQYQVTDGAVVIGGGLASLDVAKVLMFETVQKALAKLGHETDLFALDRSIKKVLDNLGLTLDDLGIKGCTLYYRRRLKDMPLSPLPTDTPEQQAKAETVREKIHNNYQSKYLFNTKPLHVPIAKITDNDHLAGLVFKETKIENGRAVAIDGTDKEVRAPLFISSIGSIPYLVDGIPSRGSVFSIEDDTYCRVQGYHNVFAIGNAVTGRGNINESLKHGRQVTQKVIDQYFNVPGTDQHEGEFRDIESRTQETVDEMEKTIRRGFDLSFENFDSLMSRIKKLQDNVGYSGDFMAWVRQHLPVRLEDMLGKAH
jgi:NADPH-dependent glutamate synthase beta subunit-like oxidoreductase